MNNLGAEDLKWVKFYKNQGSSQHGDVPYLTKGHRSVAAER